MQAQKPTNIERKKIAQLIPAKLGRGKHGVSAGKNRIVQFLCDGFWTFLRTWPEGAWVCLRVALMSQTTAGFGMPFPKTNIHETLQITSWPMFLNLRSGLWGSGWRFACSLLALQNLYITLDNIIWESWILDESGPSNKMIQGNGVNWTIIIWLLLKVFFKNHIGPVPCCIESVLSALKLLVCGTPSIMFFPTRKLAWPRSTISIGGAKPAHLTSFWQSMVLCRYLTRCRAACNSLSSLAVKQACFPKLSGLKACTAWETAENLPWN